jgi:hypothetical protein
MRDKALKSLTVCLNHESHAGRDTAVDIAAPLDLGRREERLKVAGGGLAVTHPLW